MAERICDEDCSINCIVAIVDLYNQLTCSIKLAHSTPLVIIFSAGNDISLGIEFLCQEMWIGWVLIQVSPRLAADISYRSEIPVGVISEADTSVLWISYCEQGSSDWI